MSGRLVGEAASRCSLRRSYNPDEILECSWPTLRILHKPLSHLLQTPDKSSLLLGDDAGSTSTTRGEDYWRIRYEQGLIKFETSSNGQTWNLRRSAQTSLTPNNVKIRLKLRVAFTASVAGLTRFDNFSFVNFR